MYKILKADKDSYITNRFIKIASSGSFRTGSNIGAAGTLDLFKLYGVTFTNNDTNLPTLELSRLLIHFDLQPVRDLIYSNSININHDTFNCTLKLFDVYGGQTTPSNFDVSVFPMSKSFDEGVGRDVVYYSDYDSCNFASASRGVSWEISGSGKGGGAEEICDYITASANLGVASFEVSQHFSTGEEDLNVDVTKIISATLAGILPDRGFRLSLKPSLENDSYSYFVKRFSSRTAYDSTKHPQLIIKYDDSIQDDSQNLRFDQHSTIFLRNYLHGEPANIASGSSSTEITGSNSLLLKLVTAVSGNGSYSLIFTGSQYFDGLNYYPGIYSASFTISQTNQTLYKELQHSGSVTFTPVWLSLDESIPYFTGSKLIVYPAQRSNSAIDFKNYVISTSGLQNLHRTDEKVFVRVNIFDHTSPIIKLVKRPIELSGIVIRKAYYQVRDVLTNEIILSFDEKHGSTRISSDFDGMYFNLDVSNLLKERSYVIDVMLVLGGTKKTFKSVSNVFKVSDTQVV